MRPPILILLAACTGTPSTVDTDTASEETDDTPGVDTGLDDSAHTGLVDTDDPCLPAPVRTFTWDTLPDTAPRPPSLSADFDADPVWTQNNAAIEVNFVVSVRDDQPITATGVTDPELLDRCGPVAWSYPTDMVVATDDDSFSLTTTGTGTVREDGAATPLFRLAATLTGTPARDAFGKAAPPLPAVPDALDLAVGVRYPEHPSLQVIITGTAPGTAGPAEFVVLQTP